MATETNSSSVDKESLKDRILNNILRINDDDDTHHDQDICRVCRLAGEDTLYHPCLCTGSIKYVHQDCLMQWLKYSKKEVCELCNHKFSFRPVYREDMPERLPLYEVAKGLFAIVTRFMRYFFICCVLSICWLGFVPLMASRIYRLVFSGLISSFFSSRILSLFSQENVASDIISGGLIVALFACTFFSLIWLREQIMVGGPPTFMHLLTDTEDQAAGNVEVPANARVENPNLNEANGQLNERAEAADQPTNENREQNAENAMGQPAEHNQGINELAEIMAEDNEDEHEDEDNLEIGNLGNNQPADDEEVEVERLMDDFTWQRLLGLDGSTAFIESMLYVIVINIVFDVVFLHWPAQIGKMLFYMLGYGGKLTYFDLPIHMLSGYMVIFVASYIVHELARVFRNKQLYMVSAMVYLMLKVFLLFFAEIILFPVICGWWLDVCSLPLTGTTLEARLETFRGFAFSSMFLHWLVGMIYVFYSASFILVLRELLRPGVLWFIRNLNDPEFNPILEMVQQPLIRHCRRLVASTALFFSIILLVVYIPLRLIRWVSPQTLPYIFTANAEMPMGELSLELILLQIVMPTVLEYSKAFSILKRVVQMWCKVVGGWLKLDSYLLPRRLHGENDPPNVIVNNAANAQRRAEHAQRAVDAFAQMARRNAPAAFDAFRVNENGGHVNAGENNALPEQTAAVDETDAATPSTSKLNLADNLPSLQNMNASTSTQQHSEVERPQKISVDGGEHVELRMINEEPAIPQQPEPIVIAANPPEANADAILVVAQRDREENQLRARHQAQALLVIRDNVEFEEYQRPDIFPARIVALLFCLAATAVTISFLFFLLPVTIGRFLFALASRLDGGNGSTAGAAKPTTPHDLYTLAAGLYFCWLISKVWMIAYEWCQKGWDYVCKVFRSTAWLVVRLIAAMIPLFIIIPFMFGLLFQLLVVAPLRVTISQTPLFFPWKEWAIGVLHFKIFCASVLMGPDWWLKTAFERIYAGGVRGFELRYIYVNLILPLFNFISLQISLPYVGSKIVLYFFNLSNEDKVIYTRFAYPCTLLCIGAAVFLFWQWKKLRSLTQKIRNDKYLIGTQLVNFYRESAAGAAIDAAAKSISGAGR